MRIQKSWAHLLVVPVLMGAFDVGFSKEPGGTSSGLTELVSELLRNYPYWVDAKQREVLDQLNRRLRESESQWQKAGNEEERGRARTQGEATAAKVFELLEQSGHVIRIALSGQKPRVLPGSPYALPGDAGALLLRIDNGPGETHCVTMAKDLFQLVKDYPTVGIQVGPAGTTWVLVGLRNVPSQRTTLRMEITGLEGGPLAWPLELVSPEEARLRVTVLSDDAENAPTPAMVQLAWTTLGSADRMPSNALDFVPLFDNFDRPFSHRPVRTPGAPRGDFWCVPGPFDMQIPPGEWQITIRRGLEHTPLVDTFTAGPGQLVEKSYRPRRWVRMCKSGWYSGDNHVHARMVSDEDARRIMTWVQAEDVHLASLLKVGDIYRTWFDQRGFGKPYQARAGDFVLASGQECPRTHHQLGHTVAVNITSMVRDTDRYYLYDWVADGVHAQGGLWGYAHVCSPQQFNVDRGLSIDVPRDKCDFAELLQFESRMTTDLYYDLLNLGFKMTACAGSDVPIGGTIGEVRTYAHLGEAPFSAEAWYEALRRGRTLVTNGPMIEFKVDEAGPGEEIRVTENRKLHVHARAWGDAQHMLPLKLAIIRHGETIRTVETPAGGRADEVVLDFELPAEHGFWIAARADTGDGTKAHTTPVYVIRDGLRFWKFEAVDELLAKRTTSLQEVERMVAEAQSMIAQSALKADRVVIQLAKQGDELLKRVAAARQIYDGLRKTAQDERSLRGAPE